MMVGKCLFCYADFDHPAKCCPLCAHAVSCPECYGTGIVEMYQGSVSHGNFHTVCEECGRSATKELADKLYKEGKFPGDVIN